MKVLFVVTGIGLGDATREHAVIEQLMKRHRDTKVLIAGYDKSYEYFRGKYPVIKIKGYKMLGKGMKFRASSFALRNFLLPFYWVYTTLRLRQSVKKFNPDIVISDFEPSGIAIAKSIKKKCVAVFGFDPFLYKEYSQENKVSKLMALQAKYLEELYHKSNFVIIPSLLGRRKTLVYNYVNPILRGKKLPSKSAIMRELKLKKEPIAVMLGGSGFGMKLASEIALIAKAFKNEHFIVFGGEKTATKAKNFSHYSFSKDFLKYLKASKCVITLAGQTTLSECIALNKPMLIYPIEAHVEQQLNAYALRNHAMVRKFSEERLKEDVKEFLKNLPSYQKKLNKLKVKANGAEQIVSMIRMLASNKAY
ncbi:MAG: glycosyltransferase family protein [Candidatus Woesearchaeota archaeon]